ncbi:MAG: acyl-CoA dehydratase activase-related protein [Anaeromicrobium sp.]|uniref:acyl-CoA dehydratase activase-related protein n=1 Tax=Anaeromicrobium sp. TaxID=1929132 RepID=UPI0025CD2EE0|nr:acyl-CoA dehydratase activase-related protein [Anaeromicrobium sp.]MCT4594137.1 acyl-CoA dehydratase activase-related protein [Anaeromicrobium sp.]
MKLTFPHMGNMYLPVKAMAQDLNVDVVIPPKSSKRTLELGTRYSPELMCFPMKLNLGNIIESIEQGADTVIMTTSFGPCRFGLYSQVLKEILKDLNHNVDFVLLEAPDKKYGEFLNRIYNVTSINNPIKISKVVLRALNILRELEYIEDWILKNSPYCDFPLHEFFHELKTDLENSYGTKEMFKKVKIAKNKLSKFNLNKNANPIKIGIVGEIYTVIDDFSNLNLSKKLNNMGVEVHKSLSISKWFWEHVVLGSLGFKDNHVIKVAKPFVSTGIGGHCRETIGNSILYSQANLDGVIHLMPFSCMPEIVSMSLFPNIQEKYNIPVLSLIIDEMTGEAGYLTRLEAYIDLLTSRRDNFKNEKSISWN